MSPWYVVVAMNEKDIHNAVTSLWGGAENAKQAIKWALDNGNTPKKVNQGNRLRIDAYEVKNVSTWLEGMGFVVIDGQPGLDMH